MNEQGTFSIACVFFQKFLALMQTVLVLLNTQYLLVVRQLTVSWPKVDWLRFWYIFYIKLYILVIIACGMILL